jgi:hypothetical protein
LNPFTIAALLLLCAALGVSLFQRRSAWRDASAAWPFYAKKPLASPAQVVYQRLVSALPGHLVLSRVPVSGVLGVKRGFDVDVWKPRLRHLEYDFVVCSKDATVLAAIVLDDQPRSAKDASNADGIKERASAAAGVRLIRWQAKALPDMAEIQELFGELQIPSFEDLGSSANQSWCLALQDAERKVPGP